MEKKVKEFFEAVVQNLDLEDELESQVLADGEIEDIDEFWEESGIDKEDLFEAIEKEIDYDVSSEDSDEFAFETEKERDACQRIVEQAFPFLDVDWVFICLKQINGRGKEIYKHLESDYLPAQFLEQEEGDNVTFEDCEGRLEVYKDLQAESDDDFSKEIRELEKIPLKNLVRNELGEVEDLCVEEDQLRSIQVDNYYLSVAYGFTICL